MQPERRWRCGGGGGDAALGRSGAGDAPLAGPGRIYWPSLVREAAVLVWKRHKTRNVELSLSISSPLFSLNTLYLPFSL